MNFTRSVVAARGELFVSTDVRPTRIGVIQSCIKEEGVQSEMKRERQRGDRHEYLTLRLQLD